MRKEIKIKLPETQNDLTLDQFQRYAELDKQMDEQLLKEKTLKTFIDLGEIDVRDISSVDVENIFHHLTKILNEKPELQMRFILNGIEYGFIPNLDRVSFGEFIDMDEYSKPEHYHRLMSILFRPVIRKKGMKYDIEKYSGSNEDLQQMPLGIALGALGFFLHLGLALVKNILKSVNQLDPQHRQNLNSVTNGVGMHQLTHLQGVTSINLKQQQD